MSFHKKSKEISKKEINSIATKLGIGLDYCNACDSMHIIIVLRDKERNISSFIKLNNLEQIKKLRDIISQQIELFENTEKEKQLIETIKKEKNEENYFQKNMIIIKEE